MNMDMFRPEHVERAPFMFVDKQRFACLTDDGDVGLSIFHFFLANAQSTPGDSEIVRIAHLKIADYRPETSFPLFISRASAVPFDCYPSFGTRPLHPKAPRFLHGRQGDSNIVAFEFRGFDFGHVLVIRRSRLLAFLAKLMASGEPDDDNSDGDESSRGSADEDGDQPEVVLDRYFEPRVRRWHRWGSNGTSCSPGTLFVLGDGGEMDRDEELMDDPDIPSHFPDHDGDVANLTVAHGHHILALSFLHNIPPPQAPHPSGLVGDITSFCIRYPPDIKSFGLHPPVVQALPAVLPPFDAEMDGVDFRRRFVSLPSILEIALQAWLPHDSDWLWMSMSGGGRIFLLYQCRHDLSSTLAIFEPAV